MKAGGEAAMLSARVDAAPQNAIAILVRLIKAPFIFVATVERGVVPVAKTAAEILLDLKP